MHGQGLSSLIPPKEKQEDEKKRESEVTPQKRTVSRETSGDAVFQIEIDQIVPNPYQPRRHFDEDALEELARSVREHGVVQPLVVTKVMEETETGVHTSYQLIAGERRLLAARRAGLERVPVIIRDVPTTKGKLELALIENLQRSDLNAIESARAYARLQDEFRLTQREIAARVGKSREAVANTMRLLNLPGEMQQAVQEGKINGSQARALLAIGDPGKQQNLFLKILGRKMTARAMREGVVKQKDPEIQYWERQLEERYGAPVEVRREKGQVIFRFHSGEEFRGLMDRMTGEL
jgi:ParB family chromosome partitioning protein